MDNSKKTEDIVEKLIKKRKEETDAFRKLLNAITQQNTKPETHTPSDKNKSQSIL